ncbi:hypothetical protein LTR08_004337 [Meristemomyces frigidus]|nr:hypothetical protein LTR08_004337 [Meristemomyces frigidus]
MAVLVNIRKEVEALLECARGRLLGTDNLRDRASYDLPDASETPRASVVQQPETYMATGASWQDHRMSPSATVAYPTSSTSELIQAPCASPKAEIQSKESDALAWVFDGEAEDDYTAGSSKVVQVHDGGKVCVGILPSYDLSSRLQSAVFQHRKAKAVEGMIDGELDALDKSLHTVHGEVERLGRLIVEIQQSDTDEDRLALAEMQRDVTALHHKKAECLRSRDNIQNRMDEMYVAFRQDQYNLFEQLDALLVECALLPPDPLIGCASVASTSSDVERPRETSTRSLDPKLHSASIDPGLNRKPGIDDLKRAQPIQRDLDIEQSAVVKDPKPELLYNFRTQRRNLHHAVEALDDRHETFDKEADVRDRELAEGINVETNTELELRQLQDTQKLTRRVIDAEKAYEEAKTAAIAAGIQLHGSDIESGFIDDADDGYRVSLEEELCRSIDSTRMLKWLQQLPEPQQDGSGTEYEPANTPADEGDSDDWDVRTVEISDSSSMVAEGPPRKRIDRWRAICAAAEPQPADAIAVESSEASNRL